MCLCAQFDFLNHRQIERSVATLIDVRSLPVIGKVDAEIWLRTGQGNTGCQLKTFKTFILIVKPLKPLFFSKKTFKNLYLR